MWPLAKANISPMRKLFQNSAWTGSFYDNKSSERFISMNFSYICGGLLVFSASITGVTECTL